jgi:hypothetical protein
VTLDLPPNVERAYLVAAQARGVRSADVVREVLVAAQPSGPAAELTPEEWMPEFRAWAHSHDADNLPILSDASISRDAIYH